MGQPLGQKRDFQKNNSKELHIYIDKLQEWA